MPMSARTGPSVAGKHARALPGLGMLVIAVPCLMPTSDVVAQARSSAGAGGPLVVATDAPGQLDRLTEHWNGAFGRAVKGAIGVAGLAAALSAAHSALTDARGLQGSLRGDGSISRQSGSTDDMGSPATDVGASTTTSTN